MPCRTKQKRAILLPLLRAGLDVDGCDVSPDMLALCREQAARDRLEPQLYAQASHELDLPRAYRTIYICDSFGIAGTGEALRRCYQHLVPGGALVFNLSLPYKKADDWRYWLPEERRMLPEVWRPTGNRRRTASGDEIELRSRLVDFDPLEQRVTTQMRATLWREGVAVMEEEYTLRQHLYFRNELLALLTKAGFEDAAMYGADGEALANADDLDVVFVGRKRDRQRRAAGPPRDATGAGVRDRVRDRRDG